MSTERVLFRSFLLSNAGPVGLLSRIPFLVFLWLTIRSLDASISRCFSPASWIYRDSWCPEDTFHGAVYGRLKHRKGRSVWNAVLMNILCLMGNGMSKYFIRLGFNARDMTSVCE